MFKSSVHQVGLRFFLLSAYGLTFLLYLIVYREISDIFWTVSFNSSSLPFLMFLFLLILLHLLWYSDYFLVLSLSDVTKFLMQYVPCPNHATRSYLSRKNNSICLSSGSYRRKRNPLRPNYRKVRKVLMWFLDQS